MARSAPSPPKRAGGGSGITVDPGTAGGRSNTFEGTTDAIKAIDTQASHVGRADERGGRRPAGPGRGQGGRPAGQEGPADQAGPRGRRRQGAGQPGQGGGTQVGGGRSQGRRQ